MDGRDGQGRTCRTRGTLDICLMMRSIAISVSYSRLRRLSISSPVDIAELGCELRQSIEINSVLKIRYKASSFLSCGLPLHCLVIFQSRISIVVHTTVVCYCYHVLFRWVFLVVSSAPRVYFIMEKELLER